ncbi:MAG: lasso peptide [Cyanobacteria bacterium J06600_6]
MKKTYSTPELTVHGTVNALTQTVKNFGTTDSFSVSVTIPGVGDVSIGS